MRITFQANDRIAAAVGGGIASIGAAAIGAWLLRDSARVQAARSALLGRPTAYRLHLHGTGIELAPWEKNLVRECLIRRPPEDGVRVGPVEPRPDEGGSVFQDTLVTGATKYGFHMESMADTTVSGCTSAYDDADDEHDGGRRYIPARCGNGHEFEARNFVSLRDQAVFNHHTPTFVPCPDCGGRAIIEAGRYSIRDGEVIREGIPPEEP